MDGRTLRLNGLRAEVRPKGLRDLEPDLFVEGDEVSVIGDEDGEQARRLRARSVIALP